MLGIKVGALHIVVVVLNSPFTFFTTPTSAHISRERISESICTVQWTGVIAIGSRIGIDGNISTRILSARAEFNATLRVARLLCTVS